MRDRPALQEQRPPVSGQVLVRVICAASGCSNQLALVTPDGPGRVRVTEILHEVRLPLPTADGGVRYFKPARLPAEQSAAIADLDAETFEARCDHHRLRRIDGTEIQTAVMEAGRRLAARPRDERPVKINSHSWEDAP